ncbi:MAG: PIN domain-containing protein [Candidatus Methylophosphatis roskildensis]
MRLFLDANVLFSAAHSLQGNANALFRLAGGGTITLVASSYAVEEAVRNIGLKFPQCAAELASLLQRLVLGPEPAPALISAASGFGLPEKDVPILAAAIAARADILVTGDRRDFGPLYGQAIHGVLILPPADALDKLLDPPAPNV